MIEYDKDKNLFVGFDVYEAEAAAALADRLLIHAYPVEDLPGWAKNWVHNYVPNNLYLLSVSMHLPLLIYRSVYAFDHGGVTRVEQKLQVAFASLDTAVNATADVAKLLSLNNDKRVKNHGCSRTAE